MSAGAGSTSPSRSACRRTRRAHYSAEHRTFSGLVFPTRRRVYPRRADGRPRPFPTLVWIDVDDVRVA